MSGHHPDGGPDTAAADIYNAGITWLAEPLQGAAAGPLAGRTLLVKDLIDTEGIRTTYGSRIYTDHIPARHATVVQRALDAGVTIVGKGNLPEFAWGVLGANPWYGTVHNPLHPGKTTGGSSAGNAAAIAAGLVELGIGTDTGCSIRLPSAACGTVGLKSQWGLLPLDGVFPLCPSLDTVGPMGRTVEDVALLWSVLAATAAPEPRLDGLTVGLLRRAPDLGDGRETESSDAADAWVAELERLGARVVESAIPAAQADIWPLFLHEAAWSHRETFPSRADEYADTIRPKLEAAQFVPPRAVAAAREALAAWRTYVPEVDLYVCPCYAIDLPLEDADELEVRLPLSSFLRWVNLIGWAGLALGNMQFVAPDDRTVIAAGLAWERR
ncbi:amidase [Gaiella sp.]|uniref:amidase n=1 Tax=Gaiella sp. TaxID=2663207 RepID=UPI0032655EB9